MLRYHEKQTSIADLHIVKFNSLHFWREINTGNGLCKCSIHHTYVTRTTSRHG